MEKFSTLCSFLCFKGHFAFECDSSLLRLKQFSPNEYQKIEGTGPENVT